MRSIIPEHTFCVKGCRPDLLNFNLGPYLKKSQPSSPRRNGAPEDDAHFCIRGL
jgi:hypothetical protein